MMIWGLKPLLGALAVSLALYAGVCALLWVGQRRLVFAPSPILTTTPTDMNLPHEEVWIPIESGQVHGWWLPQPQAALTLLYLHGNAGNVSSNLSKAAAFQQMGLSVLIIDYRGYGLSSGPFPSEAAMYADAAAAWQHLVQDRGFNPEQIVIFGHSIGGAIAIDLAIAQPSAAALIVEGSFTSMAAMARQSGYGWVPIRWILHQRFDSLSKLHRLQMPVFFIHGLADEAVPAEMSRHLYEAAPDPKDLWLVPGASHNDVLPTAGLDYLNRVHQFLREAVPTRP